MTYVLGIPHDDTGTDTWAKAKGLAEYADKHGFDFGRLVIGRKKDQAGRKRLKAILKVLSSFLSGEPPGTTRTCALALKDQTDHRCQPNLVIMDIRMPRMDVSLLLERSKADIPVKGADAYSDHSLPAVPVSSCH